MLRSASRLLSQPTATSRHVVLRRQHHQPFTSLLCRVRPLVQSPCCMSQSQPCKFAVRTLSTEKEPPKSQSKDANPEDSKEIVLTPGEKVVVASRVAMWTGIAFFAATCAYFIGRELLPTKMSPNRVFDRSLDMVRNDPDVKRRFGEPLKGYGRDPGNHREGRRNFIEHTEYTDKEDGSNRTRVRYNLEGRFGKAFVFAEVSNSMPSGEFVYILVQDKSNGRVFTVVDNRAALTAARLTKGSEEAHSAMSQLLSGGKK